MTPEQWSRMSSAEQSAHVSAYGPPPWPAPAVVAPRKRRIWPWVVAGVVVFFVVVASCSGRSAAPTPAAAPSPSSAPVAAAPAAPARPAGPAVTASDGTYQVGTDLAAGRYKTPGPNAADAVPNCYWSRSSDDSGDFKSLIANDNVQGPGTVSVKNGEFVKFSGGCAWTKQ